MKRAQKILKLMASSAHSASRRATQTDNDGSQHSARLYSKCRAWNVFWHFQKKTIDPHRISQSFLGVWEGSLENVLTTAITRPRDCRRDVWNLAHERRLFLPFFSSYCLNSLYIFFFPLVLKIITCNGRQVQGDERHKETKNSKLKKIQFIFWG